MAQDSRFVFISYARRDGRDLALRLRQDMVSVGYKVWLDTAEIEGGASWSSEIESAIEQCDIVLALLSQASYVSEICRAEQLRALRKGKPVIPILVQPTAERPLYFEHLNYRDFSDVSRFKDSFQLLQHDLRTNENIPLPEIQQQTIVSAPPLPPHFIPRHEDLDFLRRTVIGDETDRQIALTALRGMGGIGKSVLAAALCHDEVIQAAFPDGIVWVTIGREPGNLTEQMKFIGTKLDDSPGYYTSEAAGTDRLRTVLAHKAVLLVLDDVWDANHVLPFIVTAPRCRTLFTTRDGGIALTIGASEVQLGTLNKEQSLSLLLEWAGHQDDAMPEIAERLGYLPLALKLAGARLREGMSGREWLSTFQHVSQIKLGRRSRDPHENLEVCFDLSVQQLITEDQLLYHAVGVFPEDVSIPQKVVVRLWRKLTPELSEYDANELAIDLARLALIDRNKEDETITLHDLLHDYTRSKLGDKLKDTHLALLAAYNPKDDVWWNIPHDGYLYHQLGYHLIGAEQQPKFISLLIDQPNWMDAKFIACQGDIAYVADLDFAMRQYNDPLNADDIVILSQLFVARQIVNVRTNVYTDTDLEILVWLGRTAEALNHARLRTNPVEKYTGLRQIYRASVESNTSSASIREELLRALRDIPEDTERRTLMIACVYMLRADGIDIHTALFREALFNLNRATEMNNLYQFAARQPDTPIRELGFELAESLALSEMRLQSADRERLETLLRVRPIERGLSPAAQELFRLLTQEQRFAEAIEVATLIPDYKNLAKIALDLLERGDYDTAFRAADQIPMELEFDPKPNYYISWEGHSRLDHLGLRQKTFFKFVSDFLKAESVENALLALQKGHLETEYEGMVVAEYLIETGAIEQAIDVLSKIDYSRTFLYYESNRDRIIELLVAKSTLDTVNTFIKIVATTGETSTYTHSTRVRGTYAKVVDKLTSQHRFDEALDIARTLDERLFSLKLLLPRILMLEEAIVYHRLHQDERAVALAQRVLASDPDHIMAHLWLSIFATNAEQEAAYLQTVLQLNVHEHKLRSFADPLQTMQHLNRSAVQAAIIESVKMETGSPPVLVNKVIELGIQAHRVNHPDEARMWFVRAIDLNPQDAEAWDWLSAVVQSASDLQKCLENVQALDPTNDDAREDLQRLTTQLSLIPLMPSTEDVPEDFNPFQDSPFGPILSFKGEINTWRHGEKFQLSPYSDNWTFDDPPSKNFNPFEYLDDDLNFEINDDEPFG